MARLPLIPSHLRTPLGLLAAAILLAGAFFFPVEAACAPRGRSRQLACR